MSFALTRFSGWLWGVQYSEQSAPSSPSRISSPDFGIGFRETESLRILTPVAAQARSGPRRSRRKWRSRDERKKLDKEYDVVLVSSDGGCMSGSDSEDSDWSIGWLEPHSAEFQSDTDSENSFAVLVPCYGRGRCEQVESPKQQFLHGVEFPFHNTSPMQSNEYMEEWLASLQRY